MNAFSRMMRYVGELDPPTLWTALRDQLAEQQQGQSEGYDVSAEVHRQVFRCKPETMRQMLNHERPLSARHFALVRAYLDLTLEEATALYLANAPAATIADLVRAHELSGARPAVEPVPCRSPKPYAGFQFTYTR